MLQCAQRITEMHQNISEQVQFFKVLALDRAVRNLYISSCIFRCLHQESVKWTTKSSSGVVPVLFEQHNRSEFTMAPAQSGPLPQRNRCGIFCNSQGSRYWPWSLQVMQGNQGQWAPADPSGETWRCRDGVVPLGSRHCLQRGIVSWPDQLSNSQTQF